MWPVCFPPYGFLPLSLKTFAGLYLPPFLTLIVMSPPSNLHEVQLLISGLICVILQLHPALCSIRLGFEGSMHLCQHILHCFSILARSKLFAGLKMQQDYNFHSHYDSFAFFLTGTGYVETSYGWEILITLTALLATLSITATALFLWKRQASYNQIKSNT